jgi:hypothetical protein
MRFFLILLLLLVLRTIFLPREVGHGNLFIDLLYHILMGIFLGMTAILIEKQIIKYKSKK